MAEGVISETYTVGNDSIERKVEIGNRKAMSYVRNIPGLEKKMTPWERWWKSYLLVAPSCLMSGPDKDINIVDLFCGCGGLTLGTQEAAWAVGVRASVRVAVDADREALEVYKSNFFPEEAICADVKSIVNFMVNGWAKTARFAYPPELLHPALQKAKGGVDLVVAGPPCQGHSNLNNRTRHADPRNLLLLDAIAVVVALDAVALVVENVPGIEHDRFHVLDTAISLLDKCGYKITSAVLEANSLGWPQTRKRFFLVGSKKGVTDLHLIAKTMTKKPSTLQWAIGDLVNVQKDPVMDAAPSLSAENRRRIDYLFAHGLYELPDHLRPPCQRNGHTYPSMYGRLRWNRPAPTITTGFSSPGRGRFIHPSLKRTLTAHEAARLQGFPDWFRFCRNNSPPKRSNLAKWIGNAVPPILGYAATFAALNGL